MDLLIIWRNLYIQTEDILKGNGVVFAVCYDKKFCIIKSTVRSYRREKFFGKLQKREDFEAIMESMAKISMKINMIQKDKNLVGKNPRGCGRKALFASKTGALMYIRLLHPVTCFTVLCYLIVGW